MNFKIELVTIPVSDVDRAIDFYVNKAGFTLDHDHRVSDDLRFVQITPPGSACSIVLGTGITDKAPGSQPGVQVVVADAEAARKEPVGRGVECTEVDQQAWGNFVYFTDPDGNPWSVQAIPSRPNG
jgi:catechol 2,3-dioxygenase-like lactoylglutathione lyase family enzyme